MGNALWLGELLVKVLRRCLNETRSLVSFEATADLVEVKATLLCTRCGLHHRGALCAIHACQNIDIVECGGGYA